MSEKFSTGSAPKLTLNPQAVEAKALEDAVSALDELNAMPQPAAPDAKEAVSQLDSQLSDDELQQVNEFASQIDLTNTDHVMMYGADAQKKISAFSDSVLANVRTDNTGDVGNMLTKLISELKGFENAAEKPTGLKGLFYNAKAHLATVQAKYDDVAANVETIAASLEQHQVQLLKDVAMFNKMYEMNLEYFHELTMYIVAGEKRLQQVRDTDLKALQDAAKASGDPMDAQKAQDLAAQCDRFEKKLYDLKLTRQISLQMAPQIRLLQNNNALLVERIQSTLVNTLPEGRDGYDQRSAQEERRNPEAGHHRDRPGIRARHRGPGDPGGHQPEPDRYHQRGYADPEGRPPEAPGSRAHPGPDGAGPQDQASEHVIQRPRSGGPGLPRSGTVPVF